MNKPTLEEIERTHNAYLTTLAQDERDDLYEDDGLDYEIQLCPQAQLLLDTYPIEQQKRAA